MTLEITSLISFYFCEYMTNEILIYGDINKWSASEFITSVNKIEGDLVVRIDTNGGDPQSTFGMVAKFNEYEGPKKVKIDGRAYSSGFFFVAMVDEVEALDVSELMVHRASYSDWFENSEYFTDELKANLDRINKNLRKKFEAKIDIEKFEKIAGHTLDEIFSLDSRIDVFLTAKQAKQIGLISKVKKLDSNIKAQIEDFAKISASYNPVVAKKDKPKQKIEKMTIEKLTAEYPDIVAKIVADALAKRNDEIGAWLVFSEVDAKAVTDGIKSQKSISQTELTELTVKKISAKTLEAISGENATETKQKVIPVAGAEKLTEVESIEAKMLASLK